MTKHVLFILTSAAYVGTGGVSTGYEFSEVADPYFEFRKAGFTVDFASPAGGSPPESSYDPTNNISKAFRESNDFLRLTFSHKLAGINVKAYDAIFFPGGLGPMVDLAGEPLVKEIIRQVYEGEKIVGAVCHGPAALLDVRLSSGRYLIDGKNVSCFTSAEEHQSSHHLGEVIPFLLDQALIRQGARFSYSEPFKCHVARDGRLVTGQNPASASKVAKEMIKLMTAPPAL